MTAWERTTKIFATAALPLFGAACALLIGCGPAPGYEQQEPRVPVGYTPVQGPEPATSEELAARAQAAQQADAQSQGEIAVGADDTEYTDTDPSALTEFKPVLDGHGQWVDDSTYGTVWVPAESEVGTDFVPYSTAGHWTYADDTNWVWVSDYSWGWAPFHYGRWVHVGPRGWVWIPGRTYSGAWVVWRTGPGYDYVGWAPLGPEWYWYNGYAVGWGYGYTPYYSYCHHSHIYDHHLGPYVVRGPAARDHESHTRPYVAANPSVGGGGGRVAATPSVGPGRTAASPTVGVAGGAGARTAATARIGPRPTEFGVRPDAIVAPPSDHAGLTRAHALASPSTAVAQGAAPPAQVARRRMDHDAIATAPAPRGPGFDGRAPVASNRFDAAARAPQVQGVAPVAPRQPWSSSFSDSNPSARAPAYRSAPSFGSQPSQPSYAQPSHVQPSQPSQPSFSQPSHSQPSFSQPSHSQPSFSQPSFSQPSRSQPSVASSPPAFRSSPPAFRSSPSVSSPPPSFRSSPSVSAARSAPSPVVRSAAPSAPRPSTRSAAPAARSKR